MVPYLIDRSVIGTSKDFHRSDDGFAWCDSHVTGSLRFTGDVKSNDDSCLDSLLKLSRVCPSTQAPEKFSKSIRSLLPRDSEVALPWQHLMPKKAHQAFIKGIMSQIDDGLRNVPVEYFLGPWRAGNETLRSLQPACIDRNFYENLKSLGTGNKWAVETFAPDDNGFARTPVYDRFGTLTGRLTVSSGPSILTLKKEHRAMLRSSTPGGSIVSIDFNALEARVLLYETGKRCDSRDLYGQLALELGFERKAVKGAVICELYGASKNALGAALGIKGKVLSDFVKRIKLHFNTSELLARVKQQFIATGEIKNRYGRPVLVDEPLDHVLVNYYAQSTGVDVALMGFGSLIKLLKETCPGVRPLFVLHDALIIDVPSCHEHEVAAIDNVTVPGYFQKFYLKQETISKG